MTESPGKESVGREPTGQETPSGRLPDHPENHRDKFSLRGLNLGLEFAGVVGIFAYAGWYLDQQLGHEEPWMMLTGAVVAFVGMTYLLFRETASWRK